MKSSPAYDYLADSLRAKGLDVGDSVNSRPNCTTHDRLMYTTHSRVDVYHRASVAAV